MDLLTKIKVVVMFALCNYTNIWGQNIESIGKGKAVKISGGLSVNQIFYDAIGTRSGRTPYTYYLAGNLNFSFYGWSVPFSYIYSNQQSSFQQPFNQYSINPSYKWVTAHIGYTSMTFSSYTLSGHPFLGVGVDLNPGSRFKISAMYGRLQKAVDYDTLSPTIQPVYRRIGYGVKVETNVGKASVELIAFHSKDELNSIKHLIDSLEIYPEENIALGVNTSISLIDKLNLQAEYGSSVITRDLRSEVIANDLLYSQKTSTEKYQAVKVGVKYSQTFYSAGVSYERIDPGYRTHGAYYFNNDLENVATNATISLFKKKLNLGANVGVQHDDLYNKKMSQMLRVVSSFNVGFVPINKLNISATYSNFKSHTNVKSQFQAINQLTPYDNLDTLNFTQISENSSLNVNYTLSSTANYRQNLSFNGTFQKASEYQDQVQTNSGATFISTNVAHNLSFVKTNTAISISINYSQSRASLLTTTTVGPTLSVRRGFLKNKLKSSISASLNNSYTNGTLINTNYNLRINVGYTWQKKHNFNLTGAVIARNARNITTDIKTKTSEYTVTLGYTYNF